MLIAHPDFARLIDLPGAGPCPRPIDLDRARTGHARLVSLRVYSFAAGKLIHGEAEDDEVFVVLMRGVAEVAVDQNGERVGCYPLDARSGARAVYLPPDAAYRLNAVADCDVAYARVKPGGSSIAAPRSFGADGAMLEISGYATAMNLSLAALDAGGTVAFGGRSGAPERFLHLRSDDGGAARVNGEPLADWDVAVIGEGESVMVGIDKGKIDLLTVSAL